MAADALAAYQADRAAGKDALLLCDTTEMADALNQRLHRDTIAADAATVTGARGHRIAVNDLIVTRRNDASIPLRNTDDPAAEQSSVRNGQRWQVIQLNAETNQLAAHRLADNTLAVFSTDHVREHITHGYAVTVHSAQGATAQTTHAVLSETATRALAYVALTRGRETNTAYLYQLAPEHEYQRQAADTAHVLKRGRGQDAGRLLRAIIADHDGLPVTADDIAVMTAGHGLPSRVRACRERRTADVRTRRTEYHSWLTATCTFATAMHDARVRDVGLSLSQDCGIDL